MIFSIPQRNIYFSFFIYSFCLGVFFPRIGDLQNQMGIGETTLGLTLLGPAIGVQTVSYTHLTLPTNREV